MDGLWYFYIWCIILFVADLDPRWNIFNSGLNLILYHHYIRLVCNSNKTFIFWHTPTFLHSSLILGHSTQSCHKSSKILKPSINSRKLEEKQFIRTIFFFQMKYLLWKKIKYSFKKLNNCLQLKFLIFGYLPNVIDLWYFELWSQQD